MDLVFEIGCEELPAAALRPALEWLSAEMNRGLDDARLNGEGEGQRASIQEYATPRRLALVVRGLPARAADIRRTVQGPAAKVAFGPDGKPSKAGEGFARKMGVAPEKLRVQGDKVVVDEHIAGKTAAELLPPLLARLLKDLPWRKAMRWGAVELPFARPIHWIGAALDGQRIPLVFADVESGLSTRGHRFHAPAEFPLPSADAYVAALREKHVLVDWAERRARIWDEVQRAAREAGGEALPDDDLLETVTGLVEEPSGVAGSFDASFLELPPEVLVSEMRGHQKYFAVRNPSTGALLPAFVAVSNTRVRDPSVSRRGYERVLRARLADGKFFFDEDRKTTLASRVDRLRRIVFFQGLGSQHDRVERLRALALWLQAGQQRGDPRHVAQAAELSKADLTSGMVGEFPDLQGVMGRVYARHEGLPAEVAEALFEHHLPRGAEDRLPETDAGALLGLADRLDQLVGFFTVGKEPTGTADPYGLRRASLGILRILLQRRYRVDLREALREAHAIGERQREKGAARTAIDPAKASAALDRAWAFLAGRLEGAWKDRGPGDAIQAALHTGSADVVSLDLRLQALLTVRGQNPAAFEATAQTFKRIGNILNQAQEQKLAAMAFRPEALSTASPAERALAEALEQSRGRVQAALGNGEDYLAVYGVLAELRPQVDRFFDEVMVMDPDPKVRDNRLALLRALHELFAPLADFARLQAEQKP